MSRSVRPGVLGAAGGARSRACVCAGTSRGRASPPGSAGRERQSREGARHEASCLARSPGTDVKDAKVVSVSTGTKCINGEYMSDRGLALNDCHAEIIARRALLRFLYAQLELYLS